MEHVPAPASIPDEGSTGPALLMPHRPQSWPKCLVVVENTVLRARMFARTRLAAASWRGDQDEAICIVEELVQNAVSHIGAPTPGEEIGLVLSVDEDETLRIAVTDLSPTFPDFERALAAEDSGFARVQQLGGALSWSVSEDGETKTVEALIRYRPPQAETH